MNEKNKKILFYVLFALDAALTLFLFIVSILMLALPAPVASIEHPEPIATNMIEFLQLNPNVALGVIVVPLFILLIVNMVCLYLYVRKATQKKKVELTDLSDDEKAALRAELLNDISKKDTEDKKEE